MKTETINITKAIISVMNEVKSIDKNMNVGTGNYGYKGVADKDVKYAIGQAMQKHGLAIIPISVEPNVSIERWEENGKQKQSIFTEVRTKYLLLHESGESLEISGYGQGVDTQDKSAGKATTYALKYALLYAFMVPTGSIDDADTDHSNDKPIPQKSYPQDTREWLNKGPKLDQAIEFLRGGGKIESIEAKYRLSKEIKEVLNNVIKQL